jgi:hypothetical protein
LFFELCCAQKPSYEETCITNFVMNRANNLHFKGWCKWNFKINNCKGNTNQTLELEIVIFHTFCWLQITTWFNSLYIKVKCDITNLWFVSKYVFHIIFLFVTRLYVELKKIKSWNDQHQQFKITIPKFELHPKLHTL